MGSQQKNIDSRDENGVLEALHGLLRDCTLCPRRCRVNRLEGEVGVCKVGAVAPVSSAGPHFGEERPLVGTGGSGTIFFAGCNLGCIFCQNYDISHGRAGRDTSVDDIALSMLRLQSLGCHNINFVTPSHVAPMMAEAIVKARISGLRVPIVYNSGGYDLVEVLRLLEGLIEIYMPDLKFADPGSAERYANAPDYPEVAKAAIREMHRQVGDLEIAGGVAKRGLLVRHLVMPNGVAGSRKIMDFLHELSPDTYVNVMDQYRPMYMARNCPEIARYPTTEEFLEVYNYAREKGLRLAG